MSAPFGTSEWIKENELRNQYMEILYSIYDRGNPDHPDHDTYTGLLDVRAKHLLNIDRVLMINSYK